jgi:protein-export membrane protein SecD/preprotein translocase SecF subunit
MGEKNLWSKLGLITLLVGMSLWQIFPLKERLKAGIDLAGGSSLLFEIDDSGLRSDEKVGLAERVSTILKERVDPQGNRNLVWRPIGRNRLEIQMPRPPEGQKENREAYEKIRNQISKTNITEAEVRSALSAAPAERAATFASMSELVPSRKGLFEKLVAADEKYKQLEKTTSQPAGAASTQPVEASLARETDDAFIQRNKLIEDILKTNLDPQVLQDLLELGKKSPVRAERIGKLKDAYPDLAGLITASVDSYDQWAKQKGMLDDPSDLIRLLRGAGVLEFRILAQRSSQNPTMLDSSNPKYNESADKYIEQLTKFGPRPRPGENFYRWFKITKAEDSKGFPDPPYVVQEYMGAKYVLAHSTPDMGLLNDHTWSLKSASNGRDQMGRPAVNFSLASRGKFGKLTGDNLNRPLCIFLDEEAISAANIQSQINDHGEITGSFSQQYVTYLVNTLEAGALPARLKEVPLQEKTVGPSLGETNRSKGELAIVLSVLATVLFMAVYYSYNGLIADIAVLLNLVITLGVMSFLQATFTLPGIAGLILTLGMAVDANVLIFERMREELQRGVSARMAVKLGYEKAFSAIFDSNLTTIISAAILAWIGSEEIKGFGITLGIGLVISMFTALFVTRQYYNIMIPLSLNQQETRRSWVSTLVLGLFAGAMLGAGYVFHHGQPMNESALWNFGRFLGVMFLTAGGLMVSLWAFRIAYRVIGHQKQNRLPMLKLMSNPKIDWMGKYRVFWTISAITIVAGLALMWVGLRDTTLLDIEFVGGTSVQVQLKPEYAKLTDDQVLTYVTGPRQDKKDAGEWLNWAAGQVAAAKVTPGGPSQYTIVPAGKIGSNDLKQLLLPTFEKYISRGGLTSAEGGVIVQFDPDKSASIKDVGAVQNLLREDADYLIAAAGKISSARIQMVEDKSAAEGRKSYEIVTTETNKPVVSTALLNGMGEMLQATQPIEATLLKDPERAADGIFTVKQEDNTLAEVVGGTSQEPVGAFRGGLALVFDGLQPPQTVAELQNRLHQMRLQPEFENLPWRDFKVIGIQPAPGGSGSNPAFTKAAILVNDKNMPFFDSPDWRSQVAEKELSLAQAALGSSQSLQRVTQFAPQVATEAAQKAVIAVILSLVAIAAYLWVRFGSLEFGVAGILGLYHDVAVGLACVVASHYVYDTWFGHLIGLRDFKIDLSIVAALLTIIGYSINDAIVIFDRIRENRGRLATISTKLVNDSINQTLSRTILTVLTVFIVVVILYVAGGEGIKGFAFVMIIGCITGSYSTFAISCTMLRHPKVMWVVSMLLVAITSVGVVFMMTSGVVAWVLSAIVVGLVGFALTKLEKSAAAAQRAEPVAVA